MDETILEGRVICAVARVPNHGRAQEVIEVDEHPLSQIKEGGPLLQRLSITELAGVVSAMSLNSGAQSAIEQLKEAKYKVGIISDSYTLATGIIARTLNLDFDIANVLRVRCAQRQAN